MILFELKCSSGHVFDGWFRDNEAYEAQAAAGEIACPICADNQVAKAPMAPRIGRSRGDVAERRQEVLAAMHSKLAEMRRHIEANFDYVGANFPEEARRIHYDEAEPRDIYGEATEAEARELIEEGVKIARIPWVERTN